VKKWVGKSGLFHFQRNALVPVLFLIFLTLNTSTFQLQTLAIEQMALSSNKTLEAAVGQMALDELLASYDLNPNEQKTFASSSVRRTMQLLEILSEIEQLTCINRTLQKDILSWLSHSKTAPLNSSSPYRFWWGTIDRSLDAARILKLLGYLNETVVADITGQIKDSFGGSEPVFSLTHKDNDKVYAEIDHLSFLRVM
jgi:hypothetical protein